MARIDQLSFFNRTNEQPAWMAEPLGHNTLIPGGARVDTSTFSGLVLQTATVDGAHAAGVTSIAIDPAFDGEKMLAGTFMEFAAVPGTFVRLSDTVVNGDVALPVFDTPAALADNDVLNHVLDPKIIQAGSIVGRTFAQRDANTPFHLALDTDEEFYIVAFGVVSQFGDALEAEMDVTLVRHASLIKENLLPTFATESATIQAALRAAYQMTIGVD